MWKVIATGAETGAQYTYQVDAPDYAPEDAVWDAACREHGTLKRAGKVTEFLDIRTDSYSVESSEVTELLATAEKRGLKLTRDDIKNSGGGLTIDGIPSDRWISDMTLG